MIEKAKSGPNLGKPVGLWLSDRQDAFVKGIAWNSLTWHRYCQNTSPRCGQACIWRPTATPKFRCEEGARAAEHRQACSSSIALRRRKVLRRMIVNHAAATAEPATYPRPKPIHERRGAGVLRAVRGILTTIGRTTPASRLQMADSLE